MRVFLIILVALLVSPLSALAITGQDVRTDFVQGQPAITANATADCNDTAVARYSFVAGKPATVIDATANCTAAAGGSEAPKDSIFWFD